LGFRARIRVEEGRGRGAEGTRPIRVGADLPPQWLGRTISSRVPSSLPGRQRFGCAPSTLNRNTPRTPSTVSRNLRRNAGPRGYSPERASVPWKMDPTKWRMVREALGEGGVWTGSPAGTGSRASIWLAASGSTCTSARIRATAARCGRGSGAAGTAPGATSSPAPFSSFGPIPHSEKGAAVAIQSGIGAG